VTIFDLYSLIAERHPLRMTAELMQIFLPGASMEISVEAEDHSSACRLLDTIRAMLCSQAEMTPTLAPFATSYSINEYAGINSRSSNLLRDKLPEGLRDGITANDARVEGWPTELSLMCIRGDQQTLKNRLTGVDFVAAADAALLWQDIENRHSTARTLRMALAKAPLMPDMSSSILHMWQALESLFNIDREVTYRTSLLLAEMCATVETRAITYAAAKKSYADRSKIAHGSSAPVDTIKWMRAWSLLRNAARAVLLRNAVPSAGELTDELLQR
jgi:hypothetical protein